MPNNPGRIDGDYSIGDHEEVKFVDPGSFGAVRVTGNPSKTKYLVAAAVILVAFAIILYFR